MLASFHFFLLKNLKIQKVLGKYNFKKYWSKRTGAYVPMVQYRYDNKIYSYIDIFYRKFKK